MLYTKIIDTKDEKKEMNVSKCIENKYITMDNLTYRQNEEEQKNQSEMNEWMNASNDYWFSAKLNWLSIRAKNKFSWGHQEWIEHKNLQ